MRSAAEAIAHLANAQTAELKKQKHEFGLDKDGAAEATSAAEAYAKEKSKRRVKQGLEKDPDIVTDWDVVRFVDRYGQDGPPGQG